MDAAELSDEELSMVAAALVLMMTERETAGSMRIREVWPSPSPWRWAPVAGS
jgi:hypothetical protein